MSLSFSQINASLCFPTITPYSLNNMSAAAGFSTPDAVSEFIGYVCPPPPSCYQYYAYDYGYVDYQNCYGAFIIEFVYPGTYFCAASFTYGPAYNTGVACL
jgi:hypothetical protein